MQLDSHWNLHDVDVPASLPRLHDRARLAAGYEGVPAFPHAHCGTYLIGS